MDTESRLAYAELLRHRRIEDARGIQDKSHGKHQDKDSHGHHIAEMEPSFIRLRHKTLLSFVLFSNVHGYLIIFYQACPEAPTS